LKKLCILGLGYIGLPTAAMFATNGIIVHGMDVNIKVVKTLQQREIHIEESGLKPVVVKALDSGYLTVSDKVEPSDAFIIAVPTPFKENEYGNYGGMKYKLSDMQAVTSAAESIVPFLKRGNLVILESTSPVRTTIDLIKPILENSGLKAGEDFYLAYSPERVLPGQILRELVENSRVIGGINKISAEKGKDLYSSFVKGEIVLTDSSTAEMVKLMENTYRDINIAIANEFSRLAVRYGVDVWEAISIANRHPRVKILNPGPGVGGHCISVDPWFFVESAPELSNLILTARQVNDSQPNFVVNTVKHILGSVKEKNICVLGLSFKADVDDVRESPAVEIVHLLQDDGAFIRAFEPNKVDAKLAGITTTLTLEEATINAEALLILVSHKQFLELDPIELKRLYAGDKVIYTFSGLDKEKWKAVGFELRKIGDGKVLSNDYQVD